MYQVGDYIVYGSNGVCKITDICKSPFDPSDGRDFYELRPFHNSGNSVIYTPVDNEKVKMRRLMSEEEANALVSAMPGFSLLPIPIEKQRKDIYKEAILTVDPVEYVRLIKTVTMRRKTFLANKKRLPEMDIEYDLIARRSLYAELSVVLSIPDTEMDSYLCGIVEADQATNA